jgi:nucleoside-diphosphate-sugar epimerase
MNVLVTGGAGFIGSNIVRELIRDGFIVKVIDDLSTGHKRNLDGLEVDFYNGSILDLPLLNIAMKDVQIVFHLAASIGREKSINFPLIDAELNLLGTLNVLDSMVKNDVKKIIFSSSAAVYGEPKVEKVDLDHVTEPNSPYGVSKLAAEKMIQVYKEIHNIDYVILRYFNIYGNHQRYDRYGNVIPIFMNRIYLNESIVVFGDGFQTRDFLNVIDVAKANIRSIDSKFNNKIFNLGTGQPISILSLIDMLKEYTGSNVSVIFENERDGDVKHCSASITSYESPIDLVNLVPMRAGLIEYIRWFNDDQG